MDSYSLAINSHIVFSSLFTIVSIVVLYRSVQGFRLPGAYTRFDRIVALNYLVLLYIQLVLGLLLYFVLVDKTSPNAEEASLRFWALEHFVIMMFALFLSQIGWILIKNSKKDKNKHRNTLLYFGISIVLIVGSSLIGMIWR